MTKFEITKDLAISMTTSLPIGVCLASNDGKIVYANPKAEEIFGFDEGELPGHLAEDLIPEKYRHSHKILRENYVASSTNMAMSGGRVLIGLKKSGVEISVQIGLTPLSDKYTLVTFIESSNEIIKPSSSNDPLTGLPNRNTFSDYSEKLHKLAIRNKKNIAIAFIDLDNFKSVNDQFGHQIGDMVICEVASLLSSSVRGSDVVARVGGDEFIIFLYDAGNHSHLNTILGKLVSQIAAINNIDGNSIDIGASIGATISSMPESVNIGGMVDMADKLMYKAKKAGKGLVFVNEIDL
jgi:diguanylate cyclase (GGDEF)-like protein/PAS domain S-box-containing protein